MANFRPFNYYTFFLLDKLIIQYNIKPPFLDVGCGVGNLSKHLAQKGWTGKAIEPSYVSYMKARTKLKRYPFLTVSRKSLHSQSGKFNSLFMWDVLEHIENDTSSIKKMSSLLPKNGYLVLAIPVNPQEWGWDDEFYGHYRRYTPSELSQKLERANLKPQVIWDTTFPFFWLMRKIYLSIKHKPYLERDSKNKRTEKSGREFAWDIPILGEMLDRSPFLWKPIYFLQYFFFKHHITKGFSIILVARKM